MGRENVTVGPWGITVSGTAPQTGGTGEHASLGDNLRLLGALKLSNLAGRLIGKRHLTRDEQLDRLYDALSEITTLLPADHPACLVAIRGLGASNPVDRTQSGRPQ